MIGIAGTTCDVMEAAGGVYPAFGVDHVGRLSRTCWFFWCRYYQGLEAECEVQLLYTLWV